MARATLPLAMALVALGACVTGAAGFARPYPAARVEEDWAWGEPAATEQQEELSTIQQHEVATTQAPLEKDTQEPRAAAAEPAQLLGQAVERTPEASLDSSIEQLLGSNLPSVEQILAANERSGCVTVETPLAKSTLIHKVASAGTPCVFRADEFDEAKHCMNFEEGNFGQHGWCWTKLDRSEWGSCSKACPLAGKSEQLGEKLGKLEGLIAQLAEATGVSA
mmetsp:Transcript_12160/g.28928  ORF Transcript_12160/g.28928 Transcript_12160/m.28928 type:complete len:222 (+) Transcript_12160:69-734(+)